VTDDDPSCGLTLATDELNHCAYVTDVKENSTADKMHATHESTLKNVKGAYLVGIDGKKVFGKDDAVSMLHQLHDERAKNFQPELAVGRKLSFAETWHAIAEHNIMEPSAVHDVDHQHQLALADVRSISAIPYPHLNFSESSISTEEMEMVMQAIQSQAITPAEQAIGRFTKHKLLSLSTWEQWRAGKHKQLDHFHDLKMCAATLSRDHLVRLSYGHIGSIQSSAMEHVALETAVMAHPDLHRYHMALLQHVLPVLSNLHNAFSLPLPQEKTIEFMVPTPKMLMRILRPRKVPPLCPSMTPTQTGANTGSRRNQTAL